MTQTIGGSAIHWSGRFLISYIFGLVIIHLFLYLFLSLDNCSCLFRHSCVAHSAFTYLWTNIFTCYCLYLWIVQLCAAFLIHCLLSFLALVVCLLFAYYPYPLEVLSLSHFTFVLLILPLRSPFQTFTHRDSCSIKTPVLQLPSIKLLPSIHYVHVDFLKCPSA